MKILTPKRAAEMAMQEHRCRAALKMLDVPEDVILKLQGPILFQVAHLCCMIDQPMHWRDAIRWCYDRRGEILNHAMEIERLKDEQDSASASKANGEANRDASIAGDKG